jgi:riboflavin kinase/FMN adenylyltransferase
MKVVRGDPRSWGLEPIPRAVTVGVYDGVHLGHRHVVAALREQADAAGISDLAVVTFDPHPLRVVAPSQAPRMLTTVDQRIELLEDLGLDVAAVLPFDDAVRELTPAGFARLVLAEALEARLVVVGEDFRFGRDRTGNVASLGELGDVHGFDARVVPLVGDDRPMSSTRIRGMVAAGDVAGAAAALGRPHELRGRVVHGDGRGSAIGFPTANLAIEDGTAVPGRGVYAVKAGPLGEPLAPGVANVGVRPTFAGTGADVVEIHLLDSRRELYGCDLRVQFVTRIRDEHRFEGVDELVARIVEDVAFARSALGA